MMNFDGEPD